MSNDNWKYEKKEYWENRYSSEESYDWCKKYEDIKHLMEHSIQKSDRILIIGCGNSTLSEDMYNDGYKNLVNMDYSSIVIRNMKSLLSKTCPGIEWAVMDLRNLCFLPGSFDVVIEKATLDSLLVTEKDPWNITKATRLLFNSILMQISKVLKKNGRFFSFTFAQPHFRKKLLCFPAYDWSVKHSSYGTGFPFFSYEMVKGEPLEVLVDPVVKVETQIPPNREELNVEEEIEGITSIFLDL